MIEEVTEANIKELLKKIPDNLSAVERIILCNESTVQTLLSVLFRIPIRVEIISQIEHDKYIIRWSKLVAYYAPDNQVTVCLAESIIDKENAYHGFMNGIREKSKGIGQLISSIQINTKREIIGFYSDENIFSRTYNIYNVPDEVVTMNMLVTITEVFPKDTFMRLEK